VEDAVIAGQYAEDGTNLHPPFTALDISDTNGPASELFTKIIHTLTTGYCCFVCRLFLFLFFFVSQEAGGGLVGGSSYSSGRFVSWMMLPSVGLLRHRLRRFKFTEEQLNRMVLYYLDLWALSKGDSTEKSCVPMW
jgi:hypothetical protein